jgi:DNA-3-methyladenine glycosylase
MKRPESSKRIKDSPVLPPAFFDRSADHVARDLLSKFLVRRVGRKELRLTITETEAYLGPHDRACHSARLTARTKVMFSAPGTLYIYLVYGLYLLLNVVTGPQRCGSAVLIRSAGDVQGPGRLGRALALTPNLNGKKACPGNGLWFEGGGAAPHRLLVTPRIGVESAGPRWSGRKLRFVVK